MGEGNIANNDSKTTLKAILNDLSCTSTHLMGLTKICNSDLKFDRGISVYDVLQLQKPYLIATKTFPIRPEDARTPTAMAQPIKSLHSNLQSTSHHPFTASSR